MKQNNLKKAFTLIELLVVIAIIGILATGAVGVYTSQLQKARDTTRTTDMNALRGAIEQFYQDGYVYPDIAGFFGGTDTDNKKVLMPVKDYLQKMPEDTKKGQPCYNTACDLAYTYNVDKNGIKRGAYELSIGFENQGNTASKASKDADGGNDDNRYEFTVGGVSLNTGMKSTATSNCTSPKTTGTETGFIIRTNGVCAVTFTDKSSK